MEITWQANDQKIIKAFSRVFEFNEQTHDACVQLEWAHKKLAEPNVTYPNGRESHVVAGEVHDKAEDVLMEFQLF